MYDDDDDDVHGEALVLFQTWNMHGSREFIHSFVQLGLHDNKGIHDSVLCQGAIYVSPRDNDNRLTKQQEQRHKKCF